MFMLIFIKFTIMLHLNVLLLNFFRMELEPNYFLVVMIIFKKKQALSFLYLIFLFFLTQYLDFFFHFRSQTCFINVLKRINLSYTFFVFFFLYSKLC